MKLLKYALNLDKLNHDNASLFQAFFLAGGTFDNMLASLHSERYTLTQRLNEALHTSETLINIQDQKIEWQTRVQIESEMVEITKESVQQLTSQHTNLQSQLAKNTEFFQKSTTQVEELK